MHRRVLTLLLACLLAFAGGFATADDDIEALRKMLLPGIKGEDNRRIIDSSDYPWSAIGRVNSRIGGFCTGTVIGPREVLTAAHCLWNKRTRSWLVPDAINFLAGYRRGEFIAHGKVVGFTLADPLITPEVIKPEWFFYVAFRWLKLFSGTVAILSTGFIVFGMGRLVGRRRWARRSRRRRRSS